MTLSTGSIVWGALFVHENVPVIQACDWLWSQGRVACVPPLRVQRRFKELWHVQDELNSLRQHRKWANVWREIIYWRQVDTISFIYGKTPTRGFCRTNYTVASQSHVVGDLQEALDLSLLSQAVFTVLGHGVLNQVLAEVLAKAS